MPKKAVLAIGLDPAFVDFSATPQFTSELVRRYIDAEIERVRALGFDVVSCLVDRGETAAATVEAALRSRRFDCVVIGAGLRQPAECLPLFEKVLNQVRALAPAAKIAFNTTPADTAQAVQRWIGD